MKNSILLKHEKEHLIKELNEQIKTIQNAKSIRELRVIEESIFSDKKE